MNNMKIQVFDTWVKNKETGETIHFDVFVPEGVLSDAVIEYATLYLKDIQHGPITAEECKFCHVQEAQPEQEAIINEKGCFIYKMGDNCP